MSKYTRQGVRDLDALFGKPKSKGRVLTEQPKEAACRHLGKVRTLDSGHVICETCQACFEMDWMA